LHFRVLNAGPILAIADNNAHRATDKLSTMKPQDWSHPQHPEFTLSSRKDWLDLSAINDAFESDLVYWNSRQPEDVLRKMLDNSLSLGLYHTGADDGE
jgi:hypothetical protein